LIYIFRDVELRLQKDPANEETTTSKEMALMKLFLDASGEKRAPNKNSQTSAPLEGWLNFGEMPLSYFMRRLVQAHETTC